MVDTDTYLLSCCRYIELNPVRARTVAASVDYSWSSYRAKAEGARDKILAPHVEHRRLGATSEERWQAYRALFAAELGMRALAGIREALNQELVFGSERFKDRIEVMAWRRVRPDKPGRPRKDVA